MRKLSAALQTHLDSGATTLSWCWRLVTKGGQTLGFTDHDRDIIFDDTVFEAAAGFEASEIRDKVGLSVDDLEVTSALSSERLDEQDLLAGLYDDAAVEIFRVNWQDPAQRVLVRKGSLGEVKRTGALFTAEVRGLSHYLQQTKGRLYQYQCDADVGDRRCRVEIENAAFRGSGTIVNAVSTRRFIVSGLEDFTGGWFTRGLLRFSSGAAAGQAIEIKLHDKIREDVLIELWQPAKEPILAGQSVEVTVGCDRHFSTCADKFSNSINFRGFPHMPGNDFLTRRGRASG